VDSLNQLMGTDLRPIYASERAGDIKHSFANIALAAKAFGYKPLVNFEDGLKKTIAWYRGAAVNA